VSWIRRATVDDAAQIARIHLLGYTVGAAGLLPSDYLATLDAAELETDWRDRLGLPHTGTRTLVAVANRDVHGDTDADGAGAADGADVGSASASDGASGTGRVGGSAGRGERVVGFASYVRSFDPGTPYDGPNEYAEMTLLYVDPDHWAHGIGGLLHDAVVAGMRDEGYHTARLWALPGNARALGFYRRRGWSDDHLRRVEPDHGFELTYQRYRLPLSD